MLSNTKWEGFSYGKCGKELAKKDKVLEALATGDDARHESLD